MRRHDCEAASPPLVLGLESAYRGSMDMQDRCKQAPGGRQRGWQRRSGKIASPSQVVSDFEKDGYYARDDRVP